MKPTRKPMTLVFVLSVLFAGTSFAQVHDEIYPRPIPMGVSASTTPSSPFLFTGTAGLRVQSLADPDRKFIASNNHVFAAVGPDLCPDSAPLGTIIVQPGTLDLGFDPGEFTPYGVGILVAKVQLDPSIFATNRVDAAIAITNDSLSRTEQLGIGEPNPDLGFATPGMPIIKSGRTSGVTTGDVTSVNATVIVNYGSPCGLYRFVNQVMTSDIGDPGDSGSAVLEQSTSTPVGLYFAGSASTGVMNHIFFVYQSLGVIVDGFPVAETARALGRVRQFEAADAGLRATQARHEPALFAVPGVVAVGIGRTEDGLAPAIVVYVEEMTGLVAARVPATADGVPIRIIESGPIVAH